MGDVTRGIPMLPSASQTGFDKCSLCERLRRWRGPLHSIPKPGKEKSLVNLTVFLHRQPQRLPHFSDYSFPQSIGLKKMITKEEEEKNHSGK